MLKSSTYWYVLWVWGLKQLVSSNNNWSEIRYANEKHVQGRWVLHCAHLLHFFSAFLMETFGECRACRDSAMEAMETLCGKPSKPLKACWDCMAKDNSWRWCCTHCNSQSSETPLPRSPSGFISTNFTIQDIPTFTYVRFLFTYFTVKNIQTHTHT